jgi:AcrR family transcriptional regulator
VSDDDRSYHHGDLPAALLAAVEQVVQERGPAAITLREVARRAGVSHAAPAHHFGDKAGLLTAYAIEGFEELRHRLQTAGDAAAQGGLSPFAAIGLAYVRFAIEEPARFAVMFRPEHLHGDDADYRAAGDGAFGVLMSAVRQIRPDLADDDPQLLLAATGAWSSVHGLATLWLDGNLDERITSLSPDEATAATLSAYGATLFAASGATPPPDGGISPLHYLDVPPDRGNAEA